MPMDRVDDMSQDIIKYNNYCRSLSMQQQQKPSNATPVFSSRDFPTLFLP